MKPASLFFIALSCALLSACNTTSSNSNMESMSLKNITTACYDADLAIRLGRLHIYGYMTVNEVFDRLKSYIVSGECKIYDKGYIVRKPNIFLDKVTNFLDPKTGKQLWVVIMPT